jgi:hypothetical protein
MADPRPVVARLVAPPLVETRPADRRTAEATAAALAARVLAEMEKAAPVPVALEARPKAAQPKRALAAPVAMRVTAETASPATHSGTMAQTPSRKRSHHLGTVESKMK